MLLLIIRQLTISLVKPLSQIIHPLDKIIKATIILQEIIPPIQGQEYLGKTTTLQLTLSLVKITIIRVIINPKTIIMVSLGRIITPLGVITYSMPAHREQAFLGITLKLDRIMLILRSLVQTRRISPIISQIRCLINLITLFLKWLEVEIILNLSYNKVYLQFISYL